MSAPTATNPQTQNRLTMSELYETLAAGNIFKMRFTNKADAKSFRDRLATHKFRAERQLKLLGVIEPLSLCMAFDEDTQVAEFSIKKREPKELICYEVLEIFEAAPEQSSTDS